MTAKGIRGLLFGLPLAVAAYYALWGGEYSAFDLIRLRQQQMDQSAQLVAARAELDSLRTVADRLENDAPTIERVARERFGMIREGEMLYRFVEVGDTFGERKGDPDEPLETP